MNPVHPSRLTAGLLLFLFLFLLLLPLRLHATQFNFGGSSNPIPDGNASGWVGKGLVSFGVRAPVLDVDVLIRLSGVNGDGFAGDLYAWLQHDTGFCVLLNRPGRETTRSAGFANDSLVVWLDDQASTDIHVAAAAASNPLAHFQPDGRTADPDEVTGDSARFQSLADFNGLDANGEWILFVADVAGGGQMKLDGWSLEIALDLQSIPDGGAPLLLAMGVLIACSRRTSGGRRG